MGHIRQQARRFITGGWNDLTVETRKRLLHQRMPRVLIAALGRLLQNNGVALGFRRHQAQPTCTRCILGQGEVFGGHVFGQMCAFLVTIRHDRLLHLAVDLLLGAIGGRDKAVKAGECEQQTHQANATRTDFRAHQMDPEHETMQEGQPRSALQKGHNGRMFVEALLVRPPSLERAAGNLKRLGRLTLRKALTL